MNPTSDGWRSKPGGAPRGAPLGLLQLPPVSGGWQGGEAGVPSTGSVATWSTTASFSDRCQVA